MGSDVAAASGLGLGDGLGEAWNSRPTCLLIRLTLPGAGQSPGPAAPPQEGTPGLRQLPQGASREGLQREPRASEDRAPPPPPTSFCLHLRGHSCSSGTRTVRVTQDHLVNGLPSTACFCCSFPRCQGAGLLSGTWWMGTQRELTRGDTSAHSPGPASWGPGFFNLHLCALSVTHPPS